MRLKAEFEVQEEGYDEAAEEEKEQNLLNEFVNYIKVRWTEDFSLNLEYIFVCMCVCMHICLYISSKMAETEIFPNITHLHPFVLKTKQL